ncbi:Squalene epoxidase [Kickxella alabastrina]|uniref:Squalene epoxidase n=1 Tax=Kickxella alabastrina TaxID=61397 RepID=A0ACC1IVJ2_9FUNG|nr:Squalene epoxidase [Kickxella alabastrina]
MAVSDAIHTPQLDENIDWPTHGHYEYAHLYNSRKEITTFDNIASIRASYDYIVIGAGPIGAALAYRLALNEPQSSILIIEKNWNEPDRIVGELMQPAGCQAMSALGLGMAFSGIDAVPVHGYYIAYKGKHMHVPYINKPDGGDRFRGVSFHHGRLVMNIRAACKAQANITCLEASVTALDAAGFGSGGEITGVRGVRIGPARDSGDSGDEKGAAVAARLTMVCDGITSQFRRVLNPEPVTLISHFCGFVLEHEPIASAEFFTGAAGATTHFAQPHSPAANPLPMPHNGHVLLDGIGPVLLYQMSERETRVLADIPGGALPSEASGQLRSVLRDSLSRAAPAALYPGLHRLLMDTLEQAKRIRCIGSKFIPATANRVDGAVWVGDALNVRHPLTGGGMTIGLWDVVLLTDLLRNSPKGPATLRRIKAQWYWQRRPRALVVNTLSVALHALFAAETKELGLLREACFLYLSWGSHYTMHPSGFLSGLMPSPILLVFHFFSVAIVAVWLRVSGASSAYAGGNLLFRVYSALCTLYVASGVILPFMWKEMQP